MCSTRKGVPGGVLLVGTPVGGGSESEGFVGMATIMADPKGGGAGFLRTRMPAEYWDARGSVPAPWVWKRQPNADIVSRRVGAGHSSFPNHASIPVIGNPTAPWLPSSRAYSDREARVGDGETAVSMGDLEQGGILADQLAGG